MLIVSFIKLIEKVTWLSPIVVVPKKNGKLKICVDFKTLNATIKKDPYLLPFINEVINIVTEHEIYTFLDGFFLDTIRFPSHQRTNTKSPLLPIGVFLYGM